MRLLPTRTRMRKVNTNAMAWDSWSSPKGKFCGSGKAVSEALGRDPLSTDLMKRHPFDVEILRIRRARRRIRITPIRRSGNFIT